VKLSVFENTLSETRRCLRCGVKVTSHARNGWLRFSEVVTTAPGALPLRSHGVLGRCPGRSCGLGSQGRAITRDQRRRGDRPSPLHPHVVPIRDYPPNGYEAGSIASSLFALIKLERRARTAASTAPLPGGRAVETLRNNSRSIRSAALPREISGLPGTPE
jgi:hypothetical protein